MTSGLFYELMKVAIVIVGLLMAYAEFAQVGRYRRGWIKLGLGIMGVYWSVYYVYSLLRLTFGWSFPEHQIFVRSGILITLSLVASGAFVTLHELRRLRK
jgi:hypothetical protein